MNVDFTADTKNTGQEDFPIVANRTNAQCCPRKTSGKIVNCLGCR